MAESVRSADEQQRWTTLILPVAELDCAECAQHVEQALRTVPGVLDVEGFPVARKVAVVLDPTRVDRVAIERALARAGYTVGSEPAEDTQRTWRRVALLSGVAVAVVLGVVVGRARRPGGAREPGDSLADLATRDRDRRLAGFPGRGACELATARHRPYLDDHRCARRAGGRVRGRPLPSSFCS
jgi:copper chaperone CopZ